MERRSYLCLNYKRNYFIMLLKSLKTPFLLLLALLINSCGAPADDVSKVDQDKHLEEALFAKDQFTGFIDDMLIGFTVEEVRNVLIETKFQESEKQENRINFIGEDENLVEHDVSFAFDADELLEYYVYNLGFKNNNENLVMDYQKMLQTKLEVVYDSDFETGYDDSGHFVLDWLLEGVVVELRIGLDFIALEVRRH